MFELKRDLGGLEHGAAEGVGAGPGEEEVTGVTDLLECNREVTHPPGLLMEIQVNPDLKIGHGVYIGYDTVEFIDISLGQMGWILEISHILRHFGH